MLNNKHAQLVPSFHDWIHRIRIDIPPPVSWRIPSHCAAMFRLAFIPFAVQLLSVLWQCPAGVLAVYEEQLPDISWAREGLGHISQSFAIPQGKRMVVASADVGVVAALHTKSGSVQWRSVLPAGESLDRVAAGRDLVYVLSQGGLHLRALDDQSGTVRWEASLRTASPSSQSSSPVVRSDIIEMYVGAVGSTIAVVVLSDNCVHFVDAVTGTSIDFWCVPDSKTAVIAHLSGVPIISSTGVTKFGLLCSIDGSAAAATATSDLRASDAPCRNVSVLSASLKQASSGIAAHKVGFSSGVIGSMAGRAAPVPVGAMRSFFPKDGVSTALAAHSTGSAVLLSKLSADGSGEMTQDVLYSAPEGSLNFVSRVQLLRYEAQPVVAFCVFQEKEEGLKASEASFCNVVVGSQAKLLVSCGRDGGVSSGIALQSVPVYPSFDVSSIGCASVDHAGNLLVAAKHEAYASGLIESKVALKTQSTVEALNILSTIGSNASRFQDGMHVLSSLDNVFIQAFPLHTSKASASTGFSLRALAVSSSSTSVFVQSKALLWARDDSAVYASSGFVVNRPVQDEFDSNAAFEVTGAEVPDLRRRLELQRVELRAAWHSFKHDMMTTWQLYKTQWQQNGFKAILRLFGYMSPKDSVPTSSNGGSDGADQSGLAMLEWLSHREVLDDVGKRFGFDRYAVLLSRGSISAAAAASAPDAKLSYIDSEELFDAHETLTSSSKSVLRTIKVVALDLIHGTQAWAFQPNLAPFMRFIGKHFISSAQDGELGFRQDKVKVFAKIIHDRNFVSSEGANSHQIGHLVISIRYIPSQEQQQSSVVLSKTCYYPIDLNTGAFVHPNALHGHAAADSADSFVCLPPSAAVVGAVSLDTSALSQDASHYAARSHAARFLLIHDDETVSVFPPPYSSASSACSQNSVLSRQYIHLGSHKEGAIISYVVDRESVSGSAAADNHVHCTFALRRMGSAALFSATSSPIDSSRRDRIVAVAYPAAYDKSNSRAHILGDKSLLLKYLNPNIMVVVVDEAASSAEYVSASSADTADSNNSNASATVSEEAGSAVSSDSYLAVYVLDRVTANVIYSYRIVHATTNIDTSSTASAAFPVCAEIIDNGVYVTYWNHKTLRPELSSLSLFEGLVPKNGMSWYTSLVDPSRAPYGSSISTVAISGSGSELYPSMVASTTGGNVPNGAVLEAEWLADVVGSSKARSLSAVTSSYSSPAPLGLSKTYILGRAPGAAVAALSHAVTWRGLANKHLLLSLTNGQVYAVDVRMADPRRPITAPSPTEKEEGLVQYNPYLHFAPTSVLTYLSQIPRGCRALLVAPAHILESTTLVLMLGLDVRFSRHMPSKAFDMLGPDFNRPLLTLVLGGMLLAVIVLRRMHRRNALKAAWK